MVSCYALVVHCRAFSDHLIGNQCNQYNQSSILFTPIKNINKMYYRCDSKFHLDHILDMYDDDEKYGFVLVSGENILIYIVSISENRTDISLINKKEIQLETKTKRGGSSSNRYRNIRENEKKYNKTLFSELIVKSYMTDNNTKHKIKKIILAGPTDMKHEIMSTSLFQQYFSNIVLKVTTATNMHENTINEIVSKTLADIKYSDVKEVEKEINHNLTYNYDLLGIEKTECDNCIELNNIVKIFVDQNNFTDHLDHLSNINIPVIKTNSQLVNTYGGWICIKKYQTE